MTRKRTLTFLSLITIVLFLVFILFLSSNNIDGDNTDSDTDTVPYVTVTEVAHDAVSDVTDDHEEADDERIYDREFDYPYIDMDFANDEAFEFLMYSYSKVDFYGEFKKGDLSVYDFYKEKYKKLLNNEVTFHYESAYAEKTGEYHLNEFGHLEDYSLDEPRYYFFDIDDDGAQELCIDMFDKYVFKYLPDSDEFILWKEIAPSYYRLIGTKKMLWSPDGLWHGFYILDENGEEECVVSFEACIDYLGMSELIDDELVRVLDPAFTATLPTYPNQNEQIEIPEQIKKQAYIGKWDGAYYFRITEEQFDELTKEYFEAYKLAKEKIKDVTFTYDELFEVSSAEKQ